MSSLRNKLIRLAHQNPELRPVLLPLLRVAMEHPTEGKGKKAGFVDKRPYYAGAAAEIAAEVVRKNRSRGWAGSDQQLMSDIAEHLARFNIGYVDDMWGEWAFVRGGTPTAFK